MTQVSALTPLPPPAALPVSALEGCGPQLASKLTRLGLETWPDLLLHKPLRHEDHTRITPLHQLQAGARVVVELEILSTETRVGRKPLLSARCSDEHGFLTLRFFHYPFWLAERLRTGVCLRCFGEVRTGLSGQWEMINPEVQLPTTGPLPLETHLRPIYPSTEGLRQGVLRKLVAQALTWATTDPAWQELLPEDFRQHYGLMDFPTALQHLHHPPAQLPDAAKQARRRLAFEELLAHHLNLRQARAQIQQQRAPKLHSPGCLLQTLYAQLPFQLTAAQTRAIAEIQAGLRRSEPMLRMLQGDVGSGKTVVAAAAAALALEAGYQAALMVPTELLAEQHGRKLREWFTPLGIEVLTLTSSVKGKTRSQFLHQVKQHPQLLLVGTHAIFQPDLHYARLGLVIIDEQHRFGVEQRLALQEKAKNHGITPHQLIMTATPIPRSLAMTLYADLDSTVLDEKPAGRQPIQTVLVSSQRRAEVIARVEAACRMGRQAYWVCTLIDNSETLAAQAVQQVVTELHEAAPHLRVGLIHGRMKAGEKSGTMGAFQRGELDLLVATTVIEVGVDVPNASVMIIDNAERLGLAQLHQLRGRVGRGSASSFCVLLYQPPLSAIAQQRLQTLRDTNDGFVLAQRDLELRGPGELLGTRQTGLPQFRLADLGADQNLLTQVRSAAVWLEQQAPHTLMPLCQRWLSSLERYAEV